MMIDEKSKDSDNEKNKFGEKFKKDEAKNDTTKSGSIKSSVIKSKRALENIVNENIGYIKSTAPNVHCLTNVVTMQDVANMLLAAGGSAIMAQDIKEMEEITQITSATLLNMGVPSDEKIAAYIAAGKFANKLGHPVIFDPVGVGASNYRKKCAKDIFANVHPDIIRCNQEEAKILLEFKNFGREAKNLFDFEKLNIEEADFSTKERLKSDFSENKIGLSEDKENIKIKSNGVESSIKLSEEEQERAAMALAGKYNTVAFISGNIDIISDGENVLKIDGGDSRMRKVSGTGCMLSALCALFAAGAYLSHVSAAGDRSKIQFAETADNKTETGINGSKYDRKHGLSEKYFYTAYSAGKVWKETAKNTGVSTDIKSVGKGTIGTYHSLLFNELEGIIGKGI